MLFIDHTGEIFPCGYLPVSCGSLQNQRLADIWSQSPTFLSLRDPQALHGPCRHCGDLARCGGCRAQSYAQHNDMLGSDPQCLKAVNMTT